MGAAAAQDAAAASSPPQPSEEKEEEEEREEEPAKAGAPPPPPAELAASPADPEELQRQYDELSQQLTDCQAREQAIDNEIQGAVEQDDFERAEQLEEERRSMEESLEVVRGKLKTIKAALNSFSSSDKTSTTNAAEPLETSVHVVEEIIPIAAPTPNGCQLEEEHDGEGAHDAPPSSQERQDEEAAEVAQPPPPPPPPPPA